MKTLDTSGLFLKKYDVKIIEIEGMVLLMA